MSIYRASFALKVSLASGSRVYKSRTEHGHLNASAIECVVRDDSAPVQLSLFDAGRPILPSGVTVYASGANEAREIRGFASVGISVGVAVSLIREEAICELLSSNGRVFADSGAFSEIEFGPEGVSVVAPIPDSEWQRRIAIYARLAAALGPRVSVVAPDRVADQQITLVRLARHRNEMANIAELGAEVLIPIQNGETSSVEFYRSALDVAGFDLVPAMPMKKAASSFNNVLEFVSTVRPRRLHLLGMGYERRAARRLVAMLQATAPELEISMDSNRLRAVTGRSRILTKTETRLRAEVPACIFGAVESEALSAAGCGLDYTDAIAEPSSWASCYQLEEISAYIGFSAANRHAFLKNPDGFLQTAVGQHWDVAWIELPHVAYALDRAWQQYITAEHVRAIRTAAVHITFKESRIAVSRHQERA